MKIAMIFPGYGSQFRGMAKDLYDQYPLVRKYFKEASDYLNMDFENICFFAPETELNQIDKAYLSIFVVSCSLYELLKDMDIEVTYLAGYDTGEYAALYASGGITFLECLDLVKKYSDLYITILQNNNYDILRVNGITSTKLPMFLDSHTAIAFYKTRTQHLVSGTHKAISSLEEKLRTASGVTLYQEAIGLGLHSQVMDPIVETYTSYFNKIRLKNLKIPLISNTNGSLIEDTERYREEMITLINSPVHWDKVINTLSEANLILGIGSQVNLLDLGTQQDENKNILAINDLKSLEKLSELVINT